MSAFGSVQANPGTAKDSLAKGQLDIIKNKRDHGV